MNDFLQVGQILRPKGLDGTVKVRVDADNPDFLLELPYIYTKDGDKFQRHTYSRAYENKGFLYIKFDSINGLEEAEKNRNCLLYMNKAEAPELEKGTYYIVDLVGCKIYTDNNELIGEISEVLQPGANDVYVVKNPEKTVLIPVLKHVIISTDIKLKKIVMDSKKLSEVAVYED